MMKEKEEEKPEIQVLFPEIEVEGYKVRPWSLGQVVDLTPTFEMLAIEFKRRKISLESLEKIEKSKSMEGMIGELVFAFLPQVVRLLSISLREEEKIVREFPINKSGSLIVAVVSQNLSNIKNSFGLGKSILSKTKKI